jgi:hypothetical protein
MRVSSKAFLLPRCYGKEFFFSRGSDALRRLRTVCDPIRSSQGRVGSLYRFNTVLYMDPRDSAKPVLKSKEKRDPNGAVCCTLRNRNPRGNPLEMTQNPMCGSSDASGSASLGTLGLCVHCPPPHQQFSGPCAALGGDFIVQRNNSHVGYSRSIKKRIPATAHNSSHV